MQSFQINKILRETPHQISSTNKNALVVYKLLNKIGMRLEKVGGPRFLRILFFSFSLKAARTGKTFACHATANEYVRNLRSRPVNARSISLGLIKSRKVRSPFILPQHTGKLSCFRAGISTFLPLSIASARAMRRRVECGMMTSSI